MLTDKPPLLDVSNLSVFYANLQVLWDVSFFVNEGEIVTLLGANGAGKTTLVQSIFGLLRERRGTVRFRGEEISQLPAYDVVKKGLALVPEKRELFPKMTVRENLELGSFAKVGGEADFERVLSLFRSSKSGRASRPAPLRGEQQMLAMAWALMANPS
jgi:branched-chain amino acid transport system ATP-binding protein